MGHVQPAHLPAVVLAAVDQVEGHDLVGQNLPLVVDVVEEEVERRDTLDQPALHRLPFRGGDDARQQVVGEDAFGAPRVAVDGEGDALVEEGEIGGLLAGVQLRGRQLQEPFVEELVLRTRDAVGENISS